MDWPLFALITYGFLLALIVVLIILRSRRNLRSQYARVLEEKETKLARMQIDLEESMEALDAYAEQLRLDWKKLQRDDQEGLSRLYKKEIDLEASFLALRARVTAIEVELKREKREHAPQGQPVLEYAVQPREAKEAMRQESPAAFEQTAPTAAQEPPCAAPLTPAYAPLEQAHPHARHFPAPEPEPAKPLAPAEALPPQPVTALPPSSADTAPEATVAEDTAPDSEGVSEGASEGGDVQRRAQALYEAGEDATVISQRLNISHTETSLLLKSLFLARAREQTDCSRHKAIEALEKGENPVEVARRFDLSRTEVALLAASKAHAAPAGK